MGFVKSMMGGGGDDEAAKKAAKEAEKLERQAVLDQQAADEQAMIDERQAQIQMAAQQPAPAQSLGGGMLPSLGAVNVAGGLAAPGEVRSGTNLYAIEGAPSRAQSMQINQGQLQAPGGLRPYRGIY